MDWTNLLVTVFVLLLFVLYTEERRHKKERAHLNDRIRESETLLRVYHRAAMHKLDWPQTIRLVDMAFYRLRKLADKESEIASSANEETHRAFDEWLEREHLD